MFSSTASQNQATSATGTVEAAESVHVDSEQGRFGAVLGLLKKLVGVKDIFNMRLSLPANLLDPIPNLEYWTYFDRPEMFVAIPDAGDDAERMIAVLRWWLSKDLRYAGEYKLVKPYNSVLGEQFFCHWDIDSATGQVDIASMPPAPFYVPRTDGSSDAEMLEFINEQISHHPPVSAFLARCPAKGIECRGIDQMSAKFTGTSIKVVPGEYAKGVFVTIAQADGTSEEYIISHPVGHITGFLKGSLTTQITEQSTIICARTGMAAIIEYKEERLFSLSNRYQIEAKVFSFDASNPTKTAALAAALPSMKIKDAPAPGSSNNASLPTVTATVATLRGSWRSEVFVTRHIQTSSEVRPGVEQLLINIKDLTLVPKHVKSLDEQGPTESRRIWRSVTDHINAKEFSQATKAKREIEDRQRQKTAELKASGKEHVPAIFEFINNDYARPQLKADAHLNL
ncbi:hypothetical protein GQ42DRAFT_142630 [Ramicandelaber brevisporus]|nr:hypothetical protein GQ42DRAFT_142630 [Ramicandelaber brevisporus]